MKSYTDLEQSKKLAEILPIESADMYCWKRTWKENDYAICVGHSKEWQKGFESKGIEYIPCWSLAALFSVLPPIEGFRPIIDLDINLIRYEGNYRDELCFNGNNLVDVCYEMIIKLYEKGLL